MYNVNDRVYHSGTKKVGTVVHAQEGAATVQFDNAPKGATKTTSNFFLSLYTGQEATIKKERSKRFLNVYSLRSPALESFINYLRTPEAACVLYFKARDINTASAMEAQYSRLSGGKELIVGKGYSIQDTNKQGNEGVVNFNPLATLPTEIEELLPHSDTGQITHKDKINHIDFVWRLIEEGFEITR